VNFGKNNVFSEPGTFCIIGKMHIVFKMFMYLFFNDQRLKMQHV